MEEKQTGKFFALVVLVIAFILIGSIHYLKGVQKSLWNQSVSEVQEMTDQCGRFLGAYIEKDREAIRAMSLNLYDITSGNEQAAYDFLAFLVSSGKFYTIYDLGHGVYYTANADGAQELSEEELAAYRRLPDKGLLEPYTNRYTGQRTLGYYVRFTFADGVEGLLTKGELISDMTEKFSLSFYNEQGFSCVINEAGDVMLCPEQRNGGKAFFNVFDTLEAEGNPAEETDMFRSALENGKKGAAEMLFDGEGHVFAYAPVSGTDGWYMLSIVPGDAIMQHANHIIRSMSMFAFVAVTGILVFAIFIILIRQSTLNVREKEVELKYREQLFGLLVNNTEDVFLMFTTDNYHVEYVSPNVSRILGISAKEIKENIYVLRGTDYPEGWLVPYKNIKELKVGDSYVYGMERIHKKTGEHRYFLETVYRLKIDDTDKFIFTISDRTLERRNRAALEDALSIAKAANESKSTFLSNMSHDIRTPMNAIVGLCTLLQRDAGSEERVREHTRKIISSSQHLLGLINDVLDMSKIESGKTTLNITDIFLPELVEDIVEMLRPQVKSKEQELEVSVIDVKTEYLMGDKLRIRQVLINILSNAVKYTHVGGHIFMEIRQIPTDTVNYAHLKFTVKDNGVGMTTEYLETIFEPFTREESSVTNKVQGTGLGMAITKNLIDLMGGTITVDSKPGEGSTFVVDMELRAKEQDVDKAFWQKYGIAKMLIADDDEEICLSIMKAMSAAGVSMQYVTDGENAVRTAKDAHAQGEDFDVILLDWKMPGMDGVRTADEIRGSLKDDAPLMILSAYDWGEVEEEAKASGIGGFLTKPFFLSNFMQTLEKVKDADGEAAAQEGEQSPLAGMYFLVAEDNELNAEILAEILSMVGAECDVVENGQLAVEAFEKSESGKYDMILMDVQMPVMDGHEATRRIRACAHPLAKTIPILAMTANAFVEDVQKAKAAGMNAHVAKPIDLSRLENVVRTVEEKGDAFTM